MQTIYGKFNEAKVFTDVVDEACITQIKNLCDLEPFKDSHIRIMPDCHAGASCVIGFTGLLGDKIIPNVVGVDIGCGMLTVNLGKNDIDLPKLDKIIHDKIPCGFNVHPERITKFPKLEEMYCYRELRDTKKIERAIGTLGGGNHFIEIDIDDEGYKYLVIHTGSRNFGLQVATLYQKKAEELHKGYEKYWKDRDELIEKYKAEGRRKEIESALKELKRNFHASGSDIPEEFAYLTGEYSKQYLHDMAICQEYATLNRNTIADIIAYEYGLSPIDEFETIHNYIDIESGIVRKGAVSARLNEPLLIPINMRDGSLICYGKGNEDWNYSAPHGAGRLYSRRQAKDKFTVKEFKKTMDEASIYSTSIDESTLDECPMAYKGMDDIVNNISPTADIHKIIKPIYNFKASEYSSADSNEGSDD